jgi:hypothetical protein
MGIDIRFIKDPLEGLLNSSLGIEPVFSLTPYRALPFPVLF